MFIFRIWVNLCTPRRGVCNQGVCQCENGSSAQNVSFPWRYHGAQIAGPNIAKSDFILLSLQVPWWWLLHLHDWIWEPKFRRLHRSNYCCSCGQHCHCSNDSNCVNAACLGEMLDFLFPGQAHVPFPHKCGACVHSCLEAWNGPSVPGCKPWMFRRRMNHDSMKRGFHGIPGFFVWIWEASRFLQTNFLWAARLLPELAMCSCGKSSRSGKRCAHV